jgi:predicted transcriptional regulator
MKGVDMDDQDALAPLTAANVSAFVTNNSVPVADMSGLIGKVHGALKGLSSGQEEPTSQDERVPAVPVRRSVSPDTLICIDCGKQFKSLRRHLRTAHDLTPEAYRDRWNRAYPVNTDTRYI